jgi:DNA-binding NarL/FixJ family response regulator
MLATIYRTFILEDRFFDLEAIKAILAKIPEIQVVGHNSMPGEALAFCRQRKPDLIIVDGDLYGDKTMSPAFVKNIRRLLPETRLLGMTRYDECIDPLKRAGCNYVVNKNVIENQETALKFLRETFFPKPQQLRALPPPSLNDDESRVLRLICEGNTEEQIGLVLGHANRKRVRKIKGSLFSKFNAINVAHLVYLAFMTGYLHPDDD